MRLDERLLQDYRRTFELMQRLGFNEIVIWGFYVANAWPVDIRSAVTPERGRRVEQLIHLAHQRGLKVLSGLGVYSWGFERIIRANPKLNRGNSNAMCASEPESWEWMRRVVDFVFKRFDIDGVSMQSADLGRCKCERCAAFNDAEYHAVLNVRTAEYIRSRWPKKIIGVSSWGMNFGNPANRASLLKMAKALDYLVDFNNSSRHGGPAYRRDLIPALPCDFGTLGGLQVEPPQHWARDRWFLPTCRRINEHLRQLAADGGRACEFFFHILANPSSELTFHVAGRTLADPRVTTEKALAAAIDELYRPKSNSARDDLARLILEAEEAYFQPIDPAECGTLSLEPLVGDKAGPPIYLTQRLNATQRADYARRLRAIKEEADNLRAEVGDAQRMENVARCLENGIKDLAQHP